MTSTTNGRAVRISADFFAEEAVKLHARVPPGERAGDEFFTRIIEPFVKAHGTEGLALLVFYVSKLAHLATRYLAEDKGPTVDALLDVIALDRHRRLEADGGPEG